MSDRTGPSDHTGAVDGTGRPSHDGRGEGAPTDAPLRVAYSDSRLRDALAWVTGALARAVAAWDEAVEPVVAGSTTAALAKRARDVTIDAAVVRWSRREPTGVIVVVEPGSDSLAGRLLAGLLRVVDSLEVAWRTARARRYGHRLREALQRRAARVGGVTAASLLAAWLAVGGRGPTPWGLGTALLAGGLALVALGTDSPAAVVRSSRTWRGFVVLFEPPDGRAVAAGDAPRDGDGPVRRDDGGDSS